MTDRCFRIVLLLALMPLVSGAWALVGSYVGGRSAWGSGSMVGSALALVSTIVIWHRCVRRTVPRLLSTAGIALVATGQVVLWHPVWTTGWRGTDEFLCTSQALSGGGLALGALALTWWGGLLTRCDPRHSAPPSRRVVMTPNAVRLAIGVALLPLLSGLFFVEYLALNEAPWGWASRSCTWLSYETCAVVATAVWFLLWRRAVVWDSTRRLGSLGLALLFLASPLSVFWAYPFGATGLGPLCETLCLLSPLFTFALWLAGTAWLWRDRQPHALVGRLVGVGAEGAARCPTCGYNLHGLREVRCPECGWASTVDDIVQRSIVGTLAVP